MNTEWKPIASAPQTGRTLLLGYWNSHGKWRTVRGRWMSLEYIAEHWEDPDDAEAGWFETAVEADDAPNCWPVSPSHWQPMPAPPCPTCNDQGAVGNILTAEPCPDCSSAPTSHPIPTGATGDRDWELSCDQCNGSGHVFVKHQVAERKTDVQEFKEECEACEGRGFNIAFEDIPGIAEYVKSCGASPAAGDALDAEELRCRVLSAIHDCAQLKPEDDETWDEWYCAAFDLLGTRIGEIFRAAIAQQKGEA